MTKPVNATKFGTKPDKAERENGVILNMVVNRGKGTLIALFSL
jgi:hypothetical protein